MLSIATCSRTGAGLLQSAGLLFAELVQGGAIEAECERRGVRRVYRTESAMQGYE